MGGGTVTLGEVNLNRANPCRSGQGESRVHNAHDLIRTPPASGGHPLPGGDSRSASFPVDDVHQARVTEGVWEWRMACGEDKKRGRLMMGNKTFSG